MVFWAVGDLFGVDEVPRFDDPLCEGCCNATVMQDIWQKRSTVDYRIGIQPQASVATLANGIGEGFKQGLRFAARDAYSRPVGL